MEGSSNGGMLYHEVQEAKLCAVHCVNTVLQGPFFSEFDLAALAADLDRKERQMMIQGTTVGDFNAEVSHNVSLGGDFSIQILPVSIKSLAGSVATLANFMTSWGITMTAPLMLSWNSGGTFALYTLFCAFTRCEVHVLNGMFMDTYIAYCQYFSA